MSDALEVYDAGGRLGFPGVVDAHTHVGIYAPLADDAVTESRAAVSGGVTTMLTYFRTGQYYLNRGGPYAEFFPEVLRLSEGRYHCDYAYHLAPIASGHVDEMEQLATRHGVPSFKIFMFYGGYGLHGQAGQDEQRRFLMVGPDETLRPRAFRVHPARGRPDPARAPGAGAVREREPALRGGRHPQRLHPARGAGSDTLTGLRAYSAARPPHSEGLAVWIAAYLANEAHCANVNLLHLSSRKALEAALTMAARLPAHRLQARDHGRAICCSTCDTPRRPATPRSTRPSARARTSSTCGARCSTARWTGSSAITRAARRRSRAPAGAARATSGWPSPASAAPNISWPASSARAASAAWRPTGWPSCSPQSGAALRAAGQGRHRRRLDADLALLDPDRRFTVRAADSPSGQGYTPFEGQELTGQVQATFLRGRLAWENGAVVGAARGRYIARPTSAR